VNSLVKRLDRVAHARVIEAKVVHGVRSVRGHVPADLGAVLSRLCSDGDTGGVDGAVVVRPVGRRGQPKGVVPVGWIGLVEAGGLALGDRDGWALELVLRGSSSLSRLYEVELARGGGHVVVHRSVWSGVQKVDLVLMIKAFYSY